MAFTWTPLDPVGIGGPSLQGSPNSIGGGTTHWLTCEKGVSIINGSISSNPSYGKISATVTHTCTPAPNGFSIADNNGTGGIDVTGIPGGMDTPLSIDTQNPADQSTQHLTSVGAKPASDILTHYAPTPTDRIEYTIVITTQWVGTTVIPYDTTQTEVKTYKLFVYNNWKPEKADCITLATH